MGSDFCRNDNSCLSLQHLQHNSTRARTPHVQRSPHDPRIGKQRLLPQLAGALAAIVLLQSCDNSQPARGIALTVARDSAGIEIVEFIDNVINLPIAFSIDDSVLLDLGGEKVSPVEELRPPVRLKRLPQDRYLVSDQALMKVFDAGGRFTHSIGRVGDGPGEYRRLSGVCVFPGDTVFAFGGEQASYFTVAGSHIRSFRLKNDKESIIGCFDDGTFPVSILDAGDSTRLPWRSDRATRRNASDRVLNTVGILQAGNTYPILRMPGSMTIAGEKLYDGDGRDPELHVFHKERGLIRIIRWNDPGSRVDREFLLKYLHDDTKTPAFINDRVTRAMARPLPTTVPRYFPILADDAGRIWLRDFGDPIVPGTPRRDWTVFDSAGRPLGRMADQRNLIGTSVQVVRIERDGVWLSWQDSEGFTHLTLHRLFAVPH